MTVAGLPLEVAERIVRAHLMQAGESDDEQEAQPLEPVDPDIPDDPRARAKDWPEPWIKPFLARFARHGNVTQSAHGAGVGHSTVYEWKKRSDEFAEAWAEAERQAADCLRAEAWRRGVPGWLEPVYGRDSGKDAGTVQVGTVRRFDSRLLLRMLEARCPEFQPTSSMTLSGPGGGAIPIAVTADEELLARLRLLPEAAFEAEVVRLRQLAAETRAARAAESPKE